MTGREISSFIDEKEIKNYKLMQVTAHKGHMRAEEGDYVARQSHIST